METTIKLFGEIVMGLRHLILTALVIFLLCMSLGCSDISSKSSHDATDVDKLNPWKHLEYWKHAEDTKKKDRDVRFACVHGIPALYINNEFEIIPTTPGAGYLTWSYCNQEAEK